MATRADVAKLARVSAATVTNFYNRRKNVSNDVRRRIIDAAESLGYPMPEEIGESDEIEAGEDGSDFSVDLSQDADSLGLPVSDETTGIIPNHLKTELKTVLSYMDQLLESLPDEKIEEFAQSEYYDTYKKLFKELGLV